MKKYLVSAFMISLLSPGIAAASMSIVKDNAGNVVAVDPWSYLDETVMWTSARSSNPNGGKIHGVLKVKYAVEDNNWRHSHQHDGNDTLTFVQGVMRSDALPDWYLAFTSGRQTNYNGSWESQTYISQDQWTQVIVGRESFYKQLRYGWDVMGGSVSLDDRWQARLKLFADLQLTERASLFGYAYQQIDHRRRGGSQNDRDVNSFQFEPGAQYIINNTTGVWFRNLFSSGRLERNQWGDIKNKDWTASTGIWHNWGKLSTTLSGGYGHYKKDNASQSSSEVFQNTRYKFMKISANYPITSRFTLSGEVTGTELKQNGNWVTNGKAISTEYKMMIDYNF